MSDENIDLESGERQRAWSIVRRVSDDESMPTEVQSCARWAWAGRDHGPLRALVEILPTGSNYRDDIIAAQGNEMDEDDIDLGHAETAWAWAEEFRSQAMRVFGDDPAAACTITHVEMTTAGIAIQYSGVPAGKRPMKQNYWAPDRPELIGFLARVYQLRSRRLDVSTGAVKQYPDHWDDILRAHFPHRFGASPDVGAGWADLILAFCGICDERGLHAKFTQIKEKFGGLRLYHDGSIETHEIECITDHLSLFICEECGSPGKRRTGGWIKTLCDLHAMRKR